MLGSTRSSLRRGVSNVLAQSQTGQRQICHGRTSRWVVSRVASSPQPLSLQLPVATPQFQVLRGIRTSGSLNSDVKVITCPAFAESISEGDLRWEKAVGDSVAEDEVICEIETDKTSVPVPSPVAGVIESLLVEDGATVQPGKELAKITVGASGGSSSAKKAEEPKKTKQEAPAQKEPPKQEESAPSSSSASGPVPDSAPPAPSPPSSPRSEMPVAAIRHAQTIDKPSQAAAKGVEPVVRMPPADPTKEIAGTRSEHRVKMNRMRLKISQRLKDAQNTTAMLTTFNEIDMSGLMQLRKDNQDAFVKRHGLKLGFMSAFVKASAHGLTMQPTVNAVIEENEIVYRDFVDISVAVATPKGLVVPVLRNAQEMNYADIEKGIAALGEKARTNQLAMEDMSGGTFTISNGGVFGSLFGTPIINPPQSAILGMHGVFERPVVRNGQVVIRPMMYVALTYDHRLVDGREAVTFLRGIKSSVEDPRTMLLGM
eukprot:maker-scaffold495_size155559-snap-gene-0.31 protein:Tk09233 transcript:maker-scaffold495_size155559-snap-gene-0.31-mRNA-1 annotation:"hypothetical protein TcasGA2_TC010587"